MGRLDRECRHQMEGGCKGTPICRGSSSRDRPSDHESFDGTFPLRVGRSAGKYSSCCQVRTSEINLQIKHGQKLIRLI